MAAVTHRSAPAEKIHLFRSLFRGREDVFPRRFESRNRAGYTPACRNEWVRGICDKPRVKCANCPHRSFLPLTDEVVHQHLTGHDAQGRSFVIGLYPMMADETCYLLAVDLDGEGWRDDASALRETCRILGIPVALERSRSGQGGHLWFFFEEALPASLARKLGSHVLTETMERRPDLGFRSYDRLFPNQDTLAKGGFGNLIALPMQGEARACGNSLFLDDRFIPHGDPWVFLASLRRMTRGEVEAVVRRAEGRGRIVGVRLASVDDDSLTPWMLPPSRRIHEQAIAGPLPAEVELVLGDQIYIAKEGLPASLRNRFIRMAAFQNPEFYQAQALRLPTYDKPRIIACAEDHPAHLAMPRGCLEEIRSLLLTLKVKVVLRDERVHGSPLPVSFAGELRPDQREAASALLAHDIGVLAATTAFGKTVVAAWLIAQRGVNTLVLVHRQQLMEQWVERLAEFLDVPARTVGRLGGGKKRLTGLLDVALIQSMVRKGVVDDRMADYGHLVVDECHHLSARSFELVARRAKARFVTGLSATVTRKDGHHPIIFMQCGPVRHRVDARQQAATRPFLHHVIVHPTGFRPSAPPEPDQRIEYHALCEALILSEPRNRMICADVVAAANEGRFPLVLTERTEHLRILAGMIQPHVAHTTTLQGGMGSRNLRASLDELTAFPENEGRVLLATGRFIGEGFDDPRLDTLFLAMPVSWRGTIAQYAGRLHRLHEGKREVRIHDYADLDVPMLSRMFDRRCEGYEAVGYTILLPASALPGWPPEVALPIDPVWKRDYAASVRRLVTDGVDAPLARLFVKASGAGLPDPEGGNPARSASEAFLHARLASLPQTTGWFHLNVQLPIPFDGWSLMEVDLLSADLRIAIEIDGPQHMENADAYRRDRRKDALLQENGYLVLRFLAEDVGRDLDRVLDAILRAVAHQNRRHARFPSETT